MAELELDLKGVDEAILRFEHLQENLPRAGAKGMRLAAAAMFAQSQIEVPRRTNALALTGRLGPVVEEGARSYSVAITYSGVHYTRVVHYNQHLHHKPPTKAYFLIDPLHALQDTMTQLAAEAMRVEMSK